MKDENHQGKPELLASTMDICRDFLRNVCYRDKRCKYRHLTSEELSASINTKTDPGSSNVTYEFCHDFQNQGCDRPNCKFIHCTADIEKQFHEEGILPLRLKYEFELGVQELFVAPSTSDMNSCCEKGKPVCWDFIQRQCRRGKKCRFAHIDHNTNEDFGKSVRIRQHDQIGNVCGEVTEKRLRLLQEECHSISHSPHPDALTHMKEENIMLRKEVANLRKQISGLSATNEVLLEQNAQFRLQKRQLVEGTSFPQSCKSFENQSTMSVSVPIAMSLSLPRQTPQLSNTPGLAAATLITSETLTVTPVEPAPQTAVSVRTHATVPAQAHIQIPQSMTQNPARIVSNIGANTNQLVDDLQSLTNHQTAQGLHTTVPVVPQPNLSGQSVPSFSVNQNSISLTQNIVRSIPTMTTSSSSASVMQNTSLVNGPLTGQNALPLNQSPTTQNIASGSGLVVQSGHNISVEADGKSLGHVNHNMATGQMTHATLVTTNQQNQSSARHTPGDLSASLAAVAARVMAARGSLAQPNSEIGTAQISVPTVPCGTLAPAIVPVTITTSLPMARMVPPLPLDNSSAGLLATRIESVGVVQAPAQASMVSTCHASANSISMNASHQAVNTVSGQCLSSQQQLGAPINFAITPVPTVPQAQGPSMHT